MNSKDYKKAAEVVRCAGFTVQNEAERIRLAASFCNFFMADNPRFNRDKFLVACKLKDKK